MPQSTKPKKNSMLRHFLRKLFGKPKSKKPKILADPNEPLKHERTIALMKAVLRQKDQALKSQAVIVKVCKKCPGQGCGTQIERASGCSRMRCGCCGCDFCFKCLSPWQFGHYHSCNWQSSEGFWQARQNPVRVARQVQR